MNFLLGCIVSKCRSGLNVGLNWAWCCFKSYWASFRVGPNLNPILFMGPFSKNWKFLNQNFHNSYKFCSKKFVRNFSEYIYNARRTIMGWELRIGKRIDVVVVLQDLWFLVYKNRSNNRILVLFSRPSRYQNGYIIGELIGKDLLGSSRVTENTKETKYSHICSLHVLLVCIW